MRRRVASYYLRSHDSKIEKLLGEIRKIDYRKTDTAIEALILESQLIKKYEPPYNARDKDDKSFLYVVITKENFPRVILMRGKILPANIKAVGQPYYGPFTSATSIREALRIIRKIFPYSIHSDPKLRIHTNLQKGKARKKGFVDSDKFVASHRLRPCLDYELGLCPGTCIGAISRTEYLSNIRNIKLFLSGKKKMLLRKLEKEMKTASEKLEFEKAEKLRRQIFALKHIQDTALISDIEIQDTRYKIQDTRIEGYDISNISGTSAVGSMVVFTNGKPDKDEYRKFRISTISKSDPARQGLPARSCLAVAGGRPHPSASTVRACRAGALAGGDVGMIKEMLRRRFNNPWPYPSLILIDGGKGQVNAAKSVLNEFGLDLPVVGIAKGPGRKKNEFVGYKPTEEEKKVLVKVRDEAHRFAISYHRKLRSVRFIE